MKQPCSSTDGGADGDGDAADGGGGRGDDGGPGGSLEFELEQKASINVESPEQHASIAWQAASILAMRDEQVVDWTTDAPVVCTSGQTLQTAWESGTCIIAVVLAQTLSVRL